ncbi:MAG: RNase H family protein [Bdellovibrionales bacterium]
MRAILTSITDILQSLKAIEIYTDGSSKDGFGSWAYVISKRGKLLLEKSGRVRGANSNTMEFQAALEALRSLSQDSKITLYSDSKILVDAMIWGDGPRAHQDQLDLLLDLAKRHRIQWKWIKAHSGHLLNERCDELCRLARAKP